MDTLTELLEFWRLQAGKLGEQTLQHIGLTAAALLLAVLLGVPLGLWLTRRPRWAPAVLGFAGVLQTVPSIALLGFLIPLLGIGATPAIVALLLYSLLPIIRNTVAGIQGVNPAVVEAARGLGLTNGQILRRVELPLALPVLFAGIRTATVIGVGVATLAAYVAAGGLGEFIFGGIALNNPVMILAGALPAAALAVAFDAALAGLQRLSARRLVRVGVGLLVLLPLLGVLYLLPRAGGKLQAGFSPEFVGRADGLPSLQRAYGLRRLPSVVLAPALVYEAARHADVDVIDGYSTDGRIRAYDLQVLRDDRRVFPPYFAAPVVRPTVLRAHPGLLPVLNQLAGQLSDSVMTELNYRVDYLHEPPRAVAEAFLRRRGLWRAPRTLVPGAAVVRLGSKIFAEQYILVEMYAALIRGATDLDVQTKTGLGGTTICFEALRSGAIDMYPEYTGTGLQVLLQPSVATLDSLGGQPAAVFDYVQREFRRRYGLEWLPPLGFNNTYALLMRQRQARELGIGSLSELGRYLGR
ncbi:ABC transporter permease subunit [Hymenobacter busanensis]|uniref:ABC transporter permease subunit n=1 Tax=Hymenobacter busanensis TaxID=2607656 RepID=A0A7L4ZV65_9BACT|nr:ABC transporter permease/substrate-binding protein [Hymenobacter busanensis]KAA9327570.1 ABC transporter permease subunit [Hymenobacter busanensis]QHJ06092.1 ABC transporter permease subunit [Hymenobacter busanensis]